MSITLPETVTFSIDNVLVGSITFAQQGSGVTLSFADLSTPPVTQGPWTVNLNLNSGSLGDSPLTNPVLTINRINYDRINGNIQNNGNGKPGGKIHIEHNLLGTDADWEGDDSGTRP